MSCFQLAIGITLEHEGFLSDDPDDRGRATKYGISLAFLEDLQDDDGDGFLDGDINRDGVVDARDIYELTLDEAIGIYRSRFWEPYRFEEIFDQSVANKAFDLCVNMGPRRAGRVFQRAIKYFFPDIKVDGIVGPRTLWCANECNPGQLLVEHKHEAARKYRELNNPKFINGWLNRAYS